MKTRSSSSSVPSGDLLPLVKSPAGNSRVAKLQIVDPTSSRGKSLHGLTVVNRRRPSSRRRRGNVDDSNRRSYASKGFRLPKGWTVEVSPRRNTYHIDRFYVERKTGKRLRSLVSVERYLKQSKNPKDQQQQQLVLSQHHPVPSKDFNLPDGWIVEEKHRRNSCRVDRCYIEPGTGKKFRSLPAVETYLNGGTVDSGQLSVLANPGNPPEKVKWVLTGRGGNMFSAHVSGSDVSGSVQKTWSEAFVSLIQDRL
ncbi:unnamed protein product [Eruca vesicaria subsp. sativa]|uniref:MBD domain-containing protein n=1 Tax=Eruca vesicaria subsp. sativa TaxID=29727 RepID=A0ABC8LSW5_ERUVS|nr:unnamed protein product [Eruca vesicaria subsp. sativa]